MKICSESGIQGESSQLLFSTVNERDKRQQGLKVDFKISSVDDQDFREIAVRCVIDVPPFRPSTESPGSRSGFHIGLRDFLTF